MVVHVRVGRREGGWVDSGGNQANPSTRYCRIKINGTQFQVRYARCNQLWTHENVYCEAPHAHHQSELATGHGEGTGEGGGEDGGSRSGEEK